MNNLEIDYKKKYLKYKNKYLQLKMQLEGGSCKHDYKSKHGIPYKECTKCKARQY